MKAALNGGLNLSILDGWWDEWYDGENGWSIPTADGVTDPDHRDRLEASALYDLLENQVAPRFYDRDGAGIPTRWVEMVRHTLQSLGPKVLASRMVRDYVLQLYAPAAAATRALGADLGGAKELAAWKGTVRAGWHDVRVDHVETEGIGDAPEVGSQLQVQAYVSLGALAPEDVDVQVVHGRVDADDQLADVSTVPLALAGSLEGGRFRYSGTFPLERTGAFGYTVRVLPRVDRLATPAELGLVANAVAQEPAPVGAPPLR
jgi:starch phosphorylase